MDAIHRRIFQIHSYETDFRGSVLPSSILNFLQEAAGEHAALLGLSVTELLKDGLTWVLSRYHVRVSRYPAMGEAIEVRTWPSGREGFFWLRDFEACDQAGRSVLVATSSWVLVNLATRRPLRDGREIPAERIRDERALADDFPRLPGCDPSARELRFRVGLHDLDLNDHVNHIVYVRWALESVPDDTLRGWQPVDIEASYQGEAVFGDEVLCRTRPIQAGSADGPDGCFAHGVFHAASGRELTRLRTRWTPIAGRHAAPARAVSS